MRKVMILVVATVALVAGAAPIGSASAAPVDGAAIGKAASATLLVQEAYWRGRWWGYRGPGRRRGRCLNSPSRC